MKKILLLAIIVLFNNFLYADGLWYISNEKEISVNGEQKLFPAKYQLVKLNVNNFKLFQTKIPLEDEGQYPIIELPKPDGTLGLYYIYDAPMLAPGLATRYPQIKTYTLIDINNPFATGKADFTEWGFHAKVIDGSNTFFVDPYRWGNQEWYMTYYKKDYTIPANERMECLVDDDTHEQNEIQNGGIGLQSELPQLKGQRKTFGTDKRTYRLALACTVEYAAAVGGANPTKATVLSAMVTTMNRVNGVFEREFSMKAQLISNTDDVIYLPGAPDPYTNGSGSTMLGENQTTINSVIGSSNYDFGHVFSTGGGGIAAFACVCRNNKARGVTGRNNPVGDPFDIDYVAHEMGHQFGGSHTFNSKSGSCNNNGSGSSAYEPGSGTTIMAYAGICGSNDNIQNNSDDYYHTRSLLQMSAHIEGQGNCASTVSSGNTPPNLNSINQTFNIPYKTFFELEGTATDTDNDPITYCWEQWDLGSFDSWNTVSNVNPLFRSFYPTSDNVRMFPELVKIRPEQIKTKGEVLPEVDRNLSFKLAARDIRNGYGSFNYSNDELEIQAINTGNSLFRVTSHSTTGTNWTGDTKQTVTWDPAGTQNAPISASTVDIYFSVDTGRTWPWLMASNVPNNGSYDIYAPNVATNYGLYKVKGHGNIFFDINNGYINVIPQTYPLSLSNIELDKIEIFPNPASYSLHVRNLPNNALSLQLSSTNGQILAEFEPSESLDLGNISNGMYFLKIINTKKESIIKKLIIQH